MSLASKFKTDAQLTVGGVWIDYDDAPNKDKTIPGFLLARLSVANPKYAKALQAVAEEASDPAISDDRAEAINVELMADAVVLGWRNVQPADDGVNLSYSRDNVIALLGDHEWTDLRIDLRRKAADMANYRKKALDATAGN